MANIVLSYRREDTPLATRLLRKYLGDYYGKESVFLDYDSVDVGDMIRAKIKEEIASCDILLAVIGSNYLGNAKNRKLNRLFDEKDWVRFEVESALDGNVRIIPVLIDDARIPELAALPEKMRGLRDINAIRIRTEDFDVHIQKLIAALDRRLKSAASSPAPEPPPAPVRGEDIAASISIVLEECLSGAERSVDLPGGRHMTVHIPAGSRDGENIRVAKEGAPGANGGPPGDLIVTVRLIDHAVYMRDGGDLTMKLRLPEDTARDGGSVQVVTLAGPIALTIPAASSAATTLKVRGKGLPASLSAAAGDLYVKLDVVPDARPRPVRGDDIIAQVGITLEECFAGTRTDIFLNDGGKTRSVTVRIPAGTRDGAMIRVEGEGKPGKFGGAPGDLLVSVRLAGHAKYERGQGGDLTMELEVPARVARDGGNVGAATLGGRVDVSVPARCSDQTVLRLAGKGLPATATSPAGDLYARIKILPDPETGKPGPSAHETAWRAPAAKPSRRWVWVPVILGAVVIVGAISMSRNDPNSAAPPSNDQNSAAGPAAVAGLETAAPAGAPPAAAPVQLSADEAKAVTLADETAASAEAQASLARKAKEDALAEAGMAARTATDNPETFSKSLAWNPPDDMTAATVTYRGFGADPNTRPDGKGTLTWDVGGRRCKPAVDDASQSRRYEGDFLDGAMAGLGIYHKCNGTVIWGNRKADLTDGSAISEVRNSSTFSGLFKAGVPVLGVTDRDLTNNDAIKSEAGEYGGPASRLQGYGVMTCASGLKWKGQWSNGVPAGYAVLYDATNWTIKQHGYYGSGAGMIPSPGMPCQVPSQAAVSPG